MGNRPRHPAAQVTCSFPQLSTPAPKGLSAPFPTTRTSRFLRGFVTDAPNSYSSVDLQKYEKCNNMPIIDHNRQNTVQVELGDGRVRRTSTRPFLQKRSIAGIAAILIGALATGCSSTENGVDVPKRSGVVVERVAYPVPDGGDPDQNWGDLYLPAGDHATDSVPLVVLIHGGSWQSGIGAEVMDSYARELVERRMAVYNVEYRRVGSGGGWPTTFSDVAHALDHVIEIDQRYPELTTDDELVVGHSAGAQLAMWAGTRHALRDDELGSKPAFRPTRVVSIAGPLDMTFAATHGDDRIVTALGGTPSQVPDRYRSVDPIQNIDPDTPVVAIHGTADKTVSPENSERYIRAVKAANGIGGLLLVEGEDHVSLLDENSPSYRLVVDAITQTSKKSIENLRDQHSG